MATWLALVPILLMLFCMAALGWSAARAGMVGAAAVIGVGNFLFGYELSFLNLVGPLLEAASTAVTILWIIYPALVLHEFQQRTGASERIGVWLTSISDRPQVRVLILAWFFALLLEGAAGFGTPVALVAPMLVALGFSPLRSLILALIGHAAGVSFGAMGTPMLPLLEVSQVLPKELSLAVMLLHAALGWTLLALIFHLSRTEQRPASWVIIPIAALLFALPALLLAWLTGPELPTIGGALIGGLAFVALAKRRWPGVGAEPGTRKALLLAALPYGLILVLLALTRAMPVASMTLQSFAVDWEWAGQFSGSVKPFYHPGTMLMIALVGTALVRIDQRMAIRPSLRAAANRLPKVAVALVCVLLMARIMAHSGMIDALATVASRSLGSAWPAAIPFVAALGSFATGSATASNILLAQFQLAAAEAAGLGPLSALAGQSFGAAIGNIIAPHNIVAGAATVGLIGREGAVLKTTLPVCLAYAGLGALLILAFTALA